MAKLELPVGLEKMRQRNLALSLSRTLLLLSLGKLEPAHVMRMCGIYWLTHNTVVNVAASLRTTLS